METLLESNQGYYGCHQSANIEKLDKLINKKKISVSVASLPKETKQHLVMKIDLIYGMEGRQLKAVVVYLKVNTWGFSYKSTDL